MKNRIFQFNIDKKVQFQLGDRTFILSEIDIKKQAAICFRCINCLFMIKFPLNTSKNKSLI